MKTSITLAVLLSLSFPAQARWKAEYAQQYTPRERQWFQEQKVPGSGASCCSLADGALVEEDIRGDNYWIRCPLDVTCPFKVWTQVPDAAVIRGPNRLGRPAVWWATNEEYDSGETQHTQNLIRCYSPGSGL